MRTGGQNCAVGEDSSFSCWTIHGSADITWALNDTGGRYSTHSRHTHSVSHVSILVRQRSQRNDSVWKHLLPFGWFKLGDKISAFENLSFNPSPTFLLWLAIMIAFDSWYLNCDMVIPFQDCSWRTQMVGSGSCELKSVL